MPVVDAHMPTNPSPNEGRLYDGPWICGVEIQIYDPAVDLVALYWHRCPFCGHYHMNRPQYPVSCPNCVQAQIQRRFQL